MYQKKNGLILCPKLLLLNRKMDNSVIIAHPRLVEEDGVIYIFFKYFYYYLTKHYFSVLMLIYLSKKLFLKGFLSYHTIQPKGNLNYGQQNYFLLTKTYKWSSTSVIIGRRTKLDFTRISLVKRDLDSTKSLFNTTKGELLG